MPLDMSSRAGSFLPMTSQHAQEAHIVTSGFLEDDLGPASSPPSSSPVAVTPPDCLEELEGKACCSAGLLLDQLGDLLLTAQQQNYATGRSTASLDSDGSTDGNQTLDIGDSAGSQAKLTGGSFDSFGLKRAASGAACSSSHADGVTGSFLKKRKLSKIRPRGASRQEQYTTHARLSGAFKLQFAKGPGSLRRAESLRSQLSVDEEEQVLNEVLDENNSGTLKPPPFIPQDLPIIVGNIASPFGGYAPTVPTTPTANDVVDGLTRSPQEQDPLAVDAPVIPVPPFELIPKPPRSSEEAAERRIAALLARERDERDTDGLYSALTTKTPTHRTEDEEERFWMDDSDDAELWATAAALSSPTPNPTPVNAVQRAEIYSTPVKFDIDDTLMEHVLEWILEVMPAEDHKTYYSPGDLYDLLSSSPETRFHAGYLFMRHLLHARPASTTSTTLSHTASQSPDDQEALEAVTLDVAVACLTLSVKFHRDVLFPLDVIYVQEFLDLAPHEMEFEDLESAQRDVLEAIGYRVGSASPGAFIEELWDALPTLRRLVGFDEGWEAVQEEVWEILNDALQQPELLQYPLSIITGAAVIEGVVEVLQRRYKANGVDGRGKPVGKRDARSLRKIALKCSRGVRLDIQDILQISNEDLHVCQKWLGLTTG